MAIFAMAAMAFTGCSEKEENPYYGQTTNFTLSVADMNGQKAHMEDNYACWDNGDAVNINGANYTVSVDGSDAAQIEVPMADNYYAIFPATAAAGISGNNVTVNFPRVYNYETYDLSTQKIMAPMAAKTDNNSKELSFTCLTTLWNVEVPTGYTVDSIVVNCNNAVLSGTGTVDMTKSNLVADQLYGKHTVSLHCNGAAAGTFYIPVLPVPADAKVSVSTFVKDNNNNRLVLYWAKKANRNINNHFVVNLAMPTTSVKLMPEGHGVNKTSSSAYIGTGVYQFRDKSYTLTASVKRTGAGSGYMFGNGFTQFNVDGNLPNDGQFHNIKVEWIDRVNYQYIDNLSEYYRHNGDWYNHSLWRDWEGAEIHILGLGAFNNQTCPLEVESCQIWEDGVLVRDFVAATVNDQPGLYDLVTAGFYTLQ